MNTSDQIARCVMLAEALSDDDGVWFAIKPVFITKTQKRAHRASVRRSDGVDIIAYADGGSVEDAIAALDGELTKLAKKRAEALLGVVG